MKRFVFTRLLFMIPTLIGISFVTFLLMELAPGDAVLSKFDPSAGVASVDAKQRAERKRNLMVQLELVDAAGNRISFGERYWRWVQNAAVLRFAGTAAGSARVRGRIVGALPITILLNVLALALALAVAIPLGVKAGMRTGGVLDRVTSGGAFVVYGVPEFLIATLLLLVFCGGFFEPMLPAGGYQFDSDAGVFARLADLGSHLVLPVVTLAVGYGVVLFRFLRESVSRAAESDFVSSLRGFGVEESVVRKRVLRNGISPVITILGAMLPTLVGGTVVVERVFALPGIGSLTTSSVLDRDMPMVMALTMLVATATLISLLLSDILHRFIDPRVELR